MHNAPFRASGIYVEAVAGLRNSSFQCLRQVHIIEDRSARQPLEDPATIGIVRMGAKTNSQMGR
eukprot:2340283-Alexandrium_andersonii.AAC.1